MILLVKLKAEDLRGKIQPTLMKIMNIVYFCIPFQSFPQLFCSDSIKFSLNECTDNIKDVVLQM